MRTQGRRRDNDEDESCDEDGWKYIYKKSPPLDRSNDEFQGHVRTQHTHTSHAEIWQTGPIK